MPNDKHPSFLHGSSLTTLSAYYTSTCACFLRLCVRMSLIRCDLSRCPARSLLDFHIIPCMVFLVRWCKSFFVGIAFPSLHLHLPCIRLSFGLSVYERFFSDVSQLSLTSLPFVYVSVSILPRLIDSLALVLIEHRSTFVLYIFESEIMSGWVLST